MATKEKMSAVLELRGLDLTTPNDLISDGRTPYAKNFRLYAQQSDDRRVAVSNRKGPGYHTIPLAEALSVENAATTGTSSASFGVEQDIHIQSFTALNSQRVTMVGLRLRQVVPYAGATGPVIVQLYSDNSGKPYSLLGETSIRSSEINNDTFGWIYARFISAPQLTSGQPYHIIVKIQDDGNGTYLLETTTAGTLAKKTSSALANGVVTNYSINHRVYTAPSNVAKGIYRFARDNGANSTLIAFGTNMYTINDVTGGFTSIASGLSASAVEYSFTNGDNAVFWVNGYDTGIKKWNGTALSTITDTELPILSEVLMHKDRIFGVTASDPNKLVWSENPGNPAYSPDGVTPTTASQQWYNAWLSTSFWYIPRPHNGSPITKLVSFQDALTVFTQDKKYIFTGYDKGSFYLREATGNKGALSRRGVVSDENRIYFVSDDGLYEYDGSSDKKISGLIAPLFDACPAKRKITPVLWKNQVRFYMASRGSAVNDICLIYDKDMDEMLLDTGTYIDRALYYNDADDDHELVEISSLVAATYYGEVGYSSLGTPIDFEYRLKYDGMGSPMQRKRLKRFYPILQGVDTTFPIQLAMDKDFEDSPRIKEQLLTTSGLLFNGTATFDGTATFSGGTSFSPKRQSYSGYARYWQLRVIRKAVYNRVAFVGAQFTYKLKRL